MFFGDKILIIKHKNENFLSADVAKRALLRQHMIHMICNISDFSAKYQENHS